MHPKHLWRWLALGKRAVTFILLGCMLAWGSGISIPMPNFKDTSTPFMCQDHACSCRNARNCWNHCCCFSRAEKLAWAARQKVELPDYFDEIVERERDTSSEFCGETEPQKLACHEHDHHCDHSARQAKSKPKLAAACFGTEADRREPTSPIGDSPPLTPVSLTNDLCCRALASVTLIFSPVLELDLGHGDLVCIADDSLATANLLRPDSFRAAPDPPPPRT